MKKLVHENLNEDFYPGPASHRSIEKIDDEHAAMLTRDIVRESLNEFWTGYENIEPRITAQFYHGSTDKNLAGKRGIHIGSYKACKQALEAKIGVPAEGEWDGTREYAKTLLAGKKRLEEFEKNKIYCQTGFNCASIRGHIPEDDYYPEERDVRAKYSDGTPIPLNCKPIIFPVKIIGEMTNSQYTPHTDEKANGMMIRNLKMGNARRGYYYVNIGEDAGSISAVVPDGSFLQI